MAFSFGFVVMDMPNGESFGIEIIREELDCFNLIFGVGDHSFEIKEIKGTGREEIKGIFGFFGNNFNFFYFFFFLFFSFFGGFFFRLFFLFGFFFLFFFGSGDLNLLGNLKGGFTKVSFSPYGNKLSLGNNKVEPSHDVGEC